jgi:hypothetical protein
MFLQSWRIAAVTGAMALAVAIAARCTNSPAQQQPAFRTVGNLAEVMEATVAPASTVIFDAVVYNNGVLEHAPRTNEEWEAVEHGAIALAESANLLLLPGRPMDNGDWVKMTHALSDAAVRAQKAALAKSVDQLLDAGGAIYDSCTACHAKYLVEAQARRQQRTTH